VKYKPCPTCGAGPIMVTLTRRPQRIGNTTFTFGRETSAKCSKGCPGTFSAGTVREVAKMWNAHARTSAKGGE
jgi:hypothetical protein